MQRPVPATWMRGGTSKGVFFLPGDLPAEPVVGELVTLLGLAAIEAAADQHRHRRQRDEQQQFHLPAERDSQRHQGSKAQGGAGGDWFRRGHAEAGMGAKT